MEALTIFMMLMAILAGMIGLGSLTRLLRNLRSPGAVWTYRCLLIFNLLLVVGLGFRYLEYHLAESLSEGGSYLMQLAALDLLIPLKLAFLFAVAQAGESLTRGSGEAGGRKKQIYTFTAVGSAVILSSAAALGYGRAEIAFGVHNGFEFLMVASLLGFSCYYGFIRTRRLAEPIRRRATRWFFLLQAGNFSWAMAVLILPGISAQPGGALLGAGGMFFYNIILVLWAHRWLPRLDVTAETATGLEATRLLNEFGITKREEEVIRLICEGKSNKEIADLLFISVETVKDHNNNIFRKTGVTNRVQLVNLFR